MENYESFFKLSTKGADPDYVNSIRSLVHNNLAISYRRIGLFDEADTNFKRALTSKFSCHLFIINAASMSVITVNTEILINN